MHLERNILLGKNMSRKELRREAKEELEEVKGKKKGKALAKALEHKRKCSKCKKSECSCGE